MHNRLQLISELRKITGLSLKLCKEAIDSSNGTLKDSLEILKKFEHNFKSHKLPQDNGVIFSYSTIKSTGLFKLICQSDFAARSQTISGLCPKLGALLLDNQAKPSERLYYTTWDGSTDFERVDQIIDTASLQLNEPLNLHKSIILNRLNKNNFIGSYLHGSHNFRSFENGKTGFGGSLIELEPLNLPSNTIESSLKDLANEVAIHIYSLINIHKDIVNHYLSSPIIRSNKFHEIYNKIASDLCDKQDTDDQGELTLERYFDKLKRRDISLKIKTIGLLTMNASICYEQ